MKYLLISNQGEGLYKEKGSKFLSFAYLLTHAGHAKDLIDEIKTLHFDANHCCYAYSYGLESPMFGMHDDGEPKHSAGDSILGQIKAFNVSNALVVVVRYFGGTKLGCRGLIKCLSTGGSGSTYPSGIGCLILKRSGLKFFTITIKLNYY